MFTGIVEEIGYIAEIAEVSKDAVQLTIDASLVLEDVKVGDSISVNGICLTVTNFDRDYFQVDVMPETINATSLASLEVDSGVNLERSLRPTDRMGGHFVTGHVDGVGKIERKQLHQNAVYYDISIPESIRNYFIVKGSVAVDGVSLTVFGVDIAKNLITISLIPHTTDVTILGEKTVGDIVNIECDVLGKHVHEYLKNTIRV